MNEYNNINTYFGGYREDTKRLYEWLVISNEQKWIGPGLRAAKAGGGDGEQIQGN